MTLFFVLAAVMTLGATALIAIPLLRGGRTRGSLWVAGAAATLLTAGAGALYVGSSDWSWRAADSDSPQARVSRLARHLERNPDDVEGWLTLGRSYIVLEQYPHALRAYRRANELAKAGNAEALVGLGEVLTLSDEAELAG